MTEENKAFLDRFKPFYDKVGMGGTIHMNLEDRKRMQEIIRQEWDKTYVTCITCNEGVIDLLKMAYNNYSIELAREAAAAPEPVKPKKNGKPAKQ